jgi:hypothetical protein
MSEEKNIPDKTSREQTRLTGGQVSKPNTENVNLENLPQPQTSNLKLQTAEMEVHHHGHVHSQKKWKEYLFQFLMLFLAVTLGFVVENQREHYIEHQREKKFASLLHEDFRRDTALLNRIIPIKEWRAVKLDSLAYFFELPDLQGNAAAIYYYSCFVDLSYGFAPSDATMQQLRSSGSLRYFKNHRLYNAITNYYSHCKWYQTVEDANNSISISAVIGKIFQAKSLNSMVSIAPDIMDAVQYPKSHMQLLTTDKSILNEFLIYANSKSLNNDLAMMVLSGIRTDLIKLIGELKTEYNLK